MAVIPAQFIAGNGTLATLCSELSIPVLFAEVGYRVATAPHPESSPHAPSEPTFQVQLPAYLAGALVGFLILWPLLNGIHRFCTAFQAAMKAAEETSSGA